MIDMTYRRREMQTRKIDDGDGRWLPWQKF